MKNRENELACSITIRNLKKEEQIPYELLLQADPSRERIESYIRNARCRIAQATNEIIGVCVVLANNFDDEEKSNSANTAQTSAILNTDFAYNTAEIVNISIAEKFQGHGYGKALVFDAIETARSSKIKMLEVGTGNSSIAQLAFYQKCGFRITGIDFDFFTRNYPEEIIENGIVCRDLIQMSITL